MNSPIELQSFQFTERLFPIFEYVLVQEAGIDFNASEFFPKWRKWMEMGFARAWEVEGAVLGALFTRDLFSNKLRAQVPFWFALPHVRGTPGPGTLIRAFSAAAKEAGCVDVQLAAYEKCQPEERARGHVAHGFLKSESIFVKPL